MGQYNRSIPVGSIRSVVTVNPAVVSAGPNCLSYRHNLLSNNLSRATATTSIATASYYQDETTKNGGKDGGASSRISLVATCTQIPSRYDDKTDENNQYSYSRISLASIISSPINDNKDSNMEYRVLGMQYSANNATNKSSSSSPAAYATVCIATTTIQHQPILVAIDSSGVLHTCPIKKHQKPQTKQVNSLLDMQECKFTITRGSTPKGKKSKPNKSTTSNDEELQPLLSQMNTLSARMEESIEQYTDNKELSLPSPASTTSQSPTKTTSPSKKKGRKRKHSPSKASQDIDDTSNTHKIHLVASNLNGQVLPSQYPPIVMVVSSSNSSEQWSGIAWSKISGLEDVHVPMTCIMYSSKAKCGSKIWNSIISMMESEEQENKEQECDEGIVLMGFEDGSLRAAIITTNTTNDEQQASSINIGNTKTLLQLSCNEPIISLDMFTSKSSPTLICVGALGSIVTLSHDKKDEAEIPKFIVQCPLKLCSGRLTSIACVGCQSPDNSEEKYQMFVSINDSNQSFLHRVCLNGDNHVEQACRRLPIPARMTALSIHGFPNLTGGDTTLFTVATATNKSIVMKIPLSEVKANDSTTNSSMLSLLNGRSSVAATRTSSQQKNQIKGKSSTLQSLLHKLDLASTANNKSRMQPLSDSIDQQTKDSMKEIREVTQVAASISNPSSKPLPMQCEVKHLKSGRVSIVAEEMPIAKQTTASSWITSVHIMQSCPQALSSMLRPHSTKSMTTLCFRRNKSGKPTRVVYGGTATSHSGNNNIIDVTMNDYIPISAYASLSMVYTDQLSVKRAQSVSSKTWQQLSNIAQSNNLLCSSGSAKRCSSEMYLGITLPFDIASRTNKVSPLMLDILDMRDSNHTSVNQSDSESNPREIAEKQVLQWYQQSSSQQQYTLPMIREQQLIQRHSTGSIAGDAKVYCCSNLLSVGYSGAKTKESHTANIGFGPMAVVKCKASRPENNATTSQDGEVAFAVGSSLISPEKALSMLPLIRQAFMSRSSQRSKDSMQLLEAYHLLLTEKKTVKVAKHIIRSCDDLVTKVEQVEHSCQNELLTAVVSLYEIIRALKY